MAEPSATDVSTSESPATFSPATSQGLTKRQKRRARRNRNKARHAQAAASASASTPPVSQAEASNATVHTGMQTDAPPQTPVKAGTRAEASTQVTASQHDKMQTDDPSPQSKHGESPQSKHGEASPQSKHGEASPQSKHGESPQNIHGETSPQATTPQDQMQVDDQSVCDDDAVMQDELTKLINFNQFPDPRKIAKDIFKAFHQGLPFEEDGTRKSDAKSTPVSAVGLAAHLGYDGLHAMNQGRQSQAIAHYTGLYIKGIGEEIRGVRTSVQFITPQYGYPYVMVSYQWDSEKAGSSEIFARTCIGYDSVISGNCIPPDAGEDYTQFLRKHGIISHDEEVVTQPLYFNLVLKGSKLRHMPKHDVIKQLKDKRIPNIEAIMNHCLKALKTNEDILLQLILPPYSMDTQKYAEDFLSSAFHPGETLTRLTEKSPNSFQLRSMALMLDVAQCAFTNPDPASLFFETLQHRSVALAYAVKDEYMYDTAMAALLTKRPAKATAITIPGTDKVIIHINGADIGLYPRIGERVEMRIEGVPFELPPLPNIKYSEQELIMKIFRGIVRGMEDARDLAGGDLVKMRSHTAAVLEEHTGRVKPEDQAQKTDFVQVWAKKLQPLKDQDASGKAVYEKTADQHNRILAFVEKNIKVLRLPQKDILHCPSLRATRIASIPGLEDLGMAFVATPGVHPQWDPNYGKPPPVTYQWKSLSYNMFNWAKTTRDIKDQIKKHQFTATIIRTSNEKDLKAHLNAIADITSPGDNDLHTKHSNWLLNFDPNERVSYNLVDIFPGLKHLEDRITGKPATKAAYSQTKAYPHGISPQESDRIFQLYNRMDADQKAVFQSLRDTAFGHVVISGATGCGKTSTAAFLALLTLAHMVNQSAIDALQKKARPPQTSHTWEQQDSSSQANDEVDQRISLITPPNYEEASLRRAINKHKRKLGQVRTHAQGLPRLEGFDDIDEEQFESEQDPDEDQQGEFWGNSADDQATSWANQSAAPQENYWTNPSTQVQSDSWASTTNQANYWSTPATAQTNQGQEDMMKEQDTDYVMKDQGQDDLAKGKGKDHVLKEKGRDDMAKEKGKDHVMKDQQTDEAARGQDKEQSQDNVQKNKGKGIDTGRPVNWDNEDAVMDNFDAEVPDEANDPIPTTGETNVAPIVKRSIVISGTQNGQLDDVTESICQKASDMLDRKLNILRVTDILSAANTLIRDPDDPTAAADAEFQLFEALTRFETIIDEAQPIHTPRGKSAASQYSIITKATEKIQNDKEDYTVKEILLRKRMQKENPIQYQSKGRDECRKLFKQLCEDLIKEADIIIATPCVLASLGNKKLTNPAVIWFDEAYRATEPSQLILFTQFPDALMRISSGDGIQGKPLVLSENSHLGRDEDTLFVNQFGQQLSKSLPMRMEQSAQVPIQFLRTNWRAEGGVSKCASRICYNGTLTEGKSPEDTSEATQRCKQFVFMLSHGQCLSSSLVIDLSGNNEFQVGTSCTNQTSANLIRDIVMLLFASNLCDTDGNRLKVVVITPYEAQREKLRQTIGSLSKAEYVPDLVTIRTVEGSQGCEGDITIWDLTRTSSPGFTGERHLSAVALTRARSINIIVGNSEAWKSYHKQAPNIKTLANIWSYHELRNGVAPYDGKDWEHTCFKCYKTHKNGKPNCKVSFTCPHCDKPHHIRNCRIAPEMTQTTTFEKIVGFKSNEIHVERQQRRLGKQFLTARELRGLPDREPEKKQVETAKDRHFRLAEAHFQQTSQMIELEKEESKRQQIAEKNGEAYLPTHKEAPQLNVITEPIKPLTLVKLTGSEYLDAAQKIALMFIKTKPARRQPVIPFVDTWFIHAAKTKEQGVVLDLLSLQARSRYEYIVQTAQYKHIMGQKHIDAEAILRLGQALTLQKGILNPAEIVDITAIKDKVKTWNSQHPFDSFQDKQFDPEAEESEWESSDDEGTQVIRTYDDGHVEYEEIDANEITIPIRTKPTPAVSDEAQSSAQGAQSSAQSSDQGPQPSSFWDGVQFSGANQW
ncbi:AAA domain-containing protein [Biscogniauxia mediterranea]|nr:AAA domain-containing protein [Biscogniauxia mediterranea]